MSPESGQNASPVVSSLPPRPRLPAGDGHHWVDGLRDPVRSNLLQRSSNSAQHSLCSAQHSLCHSPRKGCWRSAFSHSLRTTGGKVRPGSPRAKPKAVMGMSPSMLAAPPGLGCGAGPVEEPPLLGGPCQAYRKLGDSSARRPWWCQGSATQPRPD